MEIRITEEEHKAEGWVVGECWGGGIVGYRTNSYNKPTREELEEKLKKDFKSGGLDSGMGFQKLLGAALEVTKVVWATDGEGNAWSRREWDTIKLGPKKYSDEAYDIMQECG